MNEMRKLMESIAKINEASNDIDPETGDIRTHQRNDAEFYSDIRKLVEEAFDVIANDFTEPYDKLDRIETVLNDIDNIVSLRASGRPYAPIHEAFGDDPDPYSSERSVRQSTISLGELMDEGILDPRQVADAALQYMSEADVTDMARMYEWFGDDEDAYESVSEDGVRYDPQPGDDEPLENERRWSAGPVEVKMGQGEVALYHGHGENIFLSDDEFSVFINSIGRGGE